MRPAIIDVHVHTSNHPMKELHVTDASLSAIERAMIDHGIERALILATYFPFKGTGLHNRDLLARLGHNPRFRAIGSLDMMNAFEDGLSELTELCASGQFVGIKLYPGYQNFHVGDPRVARVLELARKHRLTVTIHGGELHHCCSATRRAAGNLACRNSFCWIDRLGGLAHPNAFRATVRTFPDVTFVIAHLANPFFEDLRGLMRDCPNVVTDLSGQFLSGSSEDTPEYRAKIVRELTRFIEEVPNGSERLLFGSDFPIQSFEATIELVEALPVSDQVRAQMYRENALRAYPQLKGERR